MGFRIPKIKTCCCCLSLKTGGSIIVGLDTFGFIALLLLSEAHSFNDTSLIDMLFYNNVTLNVFTVSCFLIIGMIKNECTLIFPWILQQSIYILFLLNNLICSSAYLGLMDVRVGELSIEFLGLVLNSYTLLVVYNRYRELKEPHNENEGIP